MICAQYIICWTGPPVTPAGTALQLERGVGRHQCCSQPAPGTLCTLQSLSLCSIFLCSYPTLLPFFLSCLTYSLPPSLTFSLPPSLSPSLPHFLPPSLTFSLPPSLSPSLPHFLPPSLTFSLPPSLPLSCPPVVMYMYTSRDICGKLHIPFILPVLTCWSHECLGQYAPLAERRVVGEGCSVATYY